MRIASPNSFTCLALLLTSLTGACSTQGNQGEFVNSPYISRTIGVGAVDYGAIEAEGFIESKPGDTVKTFTKLNFGLAPGLEFALGWFPYLSSSGAGTTRRGSGDAVIGTKYIISRADDGGLASIIEMAARLPTGSAGSSSGKKETDVFLATSVGKAFEQVSVIGSYELALLGDANSGSLLTEHNGIVAVTRRITPEVRAFAETTMVYEPDADSFAWYIGAGAGVKMGSNLELQSALQIGLNDDAADYLLIFGFSGVLGQMLSARE